MESQNYDLRGQVSELEGQILTLSQARIVDEEDIKGLNRTKMALKDHSEEAERKVAGLEAKLIAQQKSADAVMDKWTSWKKS